MRDATRLGNERKEETSRQPSTCQVPGGGSHNAYPVMIMGNKERARTPVSKLLNTDERESVSQTVEWLEWVSGGERGEGRGQCSTSGSNNRVLDRTLVSKWIRTCLSDSY